MNAVEALATCVTFMWVSGVTTAILVKTVDAVTASLRRELDSRVDSLMEADAREDVEGFLLEEEGRG